MKSNKQISKASTGLSMKQLCSFVEHVTREKMWYIFQEFWSRSLYFRIIPGSCQITSPETHEKLRLLKCLFIVPDILMLRNGISNNKGRWARLKLKKNIKLDFQIRLSREKFEPGATRHEIYRLNLNYS